MDKITSITSAATGVRFNVVIDDAIVTFYDTRFQHTEHGQAVSRYAVKTILESAGGLDLVGYEPSWKIDAAAMHIVRAWLRHETVILTPPRLEIRSVEALQALQIGTTMWMEDEQTGNNVGVVVKVDEFLYATPADGDPHKWSYYHQAELSGAMQDDPDAAWWPLIVDSIPGEDLNGE